MKVAVSWSGGKDSAIALQQLRSSAGVEIVELLTVVTAEYDRINIHGVPRSLLGAQAHALGLPVRETFIPAGCKNAVFEAAFGDELSRLKAEGVEQVAFGDLFLSDVRAFRDALLSKHAMEGCYPLWGRDTTSLIRTFVREGFKAIVCCVDLEALPQSFVGRLIDQAFIADLPADADPCGENGEFHTFVFDGPGFERPVPLNIGGAVTRGRFAYCDLTLDGADGPGPPP